jgi:carbon storage regulator CsrA
MLMLTRRIGEKIVINHNHPDQILVVVTKIRRQNGEYCCTFGIAAPPHIVVHRREIADKIDEQERRRDG